MLILKNHAQMSSYSEKPQKTAHPLLEVILGETKDKPSTPGQSGLHLW